MTIWGPKKYGDPCRECGYDWSISQREAVSLIASLPARFRTLLDGRDPGLRHPDLGWSAGAYVAHTGDNLRIFAERFAALDLGAYRDDFPYSPDLLAEARQYEQIPISGALWSLDHAAADLVEAIEASTGKFVAIEVQEQGPETPLDFVRTITHDAYHHAWDIQRTFP